MITAYWMNHMTDGPDRVLRMRGGDESEASVETLASRALSVLASKRVTAASVMSEHFLMDLTEATQTTDTSRGRVVLQDMMEACIRREDIADFYIPEVARRLGDAWCADGMSFADVTIGVARLQGFLREIGSDWFSEAYLDADAPGVMLIVPGDEFHTLGAMVLSGQLRRMGISVRMMVGRSESEVLAVAAQGHYDAFLLSAARGEKLATLRNLVEKIRAASVMPTPVVIGGSVVTRDADVKNKTGADYATTDPREALRLCGLRVSVPGARRRATSV